MCWPSIQETISIREGAVWHVTEMTTTPGAAGEAPRTGVTERPLGVLPSVSSLPMPEALCSAAFEEHGKWGQDVLRQADRPGKEDEIRRGC